MHEILSIESKLQMHMQQCDVEYAHREIQSLALDMDCIIIKQLKEISVHRSIINSMIYHERILSTGTVGLENILNMAFILFSPMA